KWVIGAEADASWGNLRDQGPCPSGLGDCGTRQTWLATVTGRLGYAFDPALFYLKGGAAFTQTEHFTNTEIGRRHWTGWTVGTGIEVALSRNWSARFEYDYLDFGENAGITHRAHEVKLGFNYRFDPFLLEWEDWTNKAKKSATKEPEPK